MIWVSTSVGVRRSRGAACDSLAHEVDTIGEVADGGLVRCHKTQSKTSKQTRSAHMPAVAVTGSPVNGVLPLPSPKSGEAGRPKSSPSAAPPLPAVPADPPRPAATAPAVALTTYRVIAGCDHQTQEDTCGHGSRLDSQHWHYVPGRERPARLGTAQSVDVRRKWLTRAAETSPWSQPSLPGHRSRPRWGSERVAVA
jgi:hypothetical protein